MALIPARGTTLGGALNVPAKAHGVVIFSHGSGSGRHSPRSQYLASVLQRERLGTLLLDLLTPDEAEDYAMRFDIDLLTERLRHAMQFVSGHSVTRNLPVGLLGASTGAAPALSVAALMPESVGAAVLQGGRPDLVGDGCWRRYAHQRC